MISNNKLNSLTEDELSLLVYAFRDNLVDSEGNVMYYKLKALNIRIIIPRLMELETKLTEEGRAVLKNLVTTLNIFP